MEKKEIRRVIKEAIMALSPEQRRSESQFVIEQLRHIIEQSGARVVALFSPLGDEVQIMPLVDMLSAECRVVVPRVEDRADGTPHMEFYDLSLSSLEEGSFGIMEPQGRSVCSADEIDLMVLPGVAFSPSGVRLGRGKGYYDRYLARDGFRAFTIGVCYACQRRESLPCEEYDRVVEMVIFGE